MFYKFFIVFQQQHSFKLQLGHSLDDGLVLHSSGKQLQSAHFIIIFFFKILK